MKAPLHFTSSFPLSHTPSHFSYTPALNLRGVFFFFLKGDGTEKDKEKESKEDRDKEGGHNCI